MKLHNSKTSTGKMPRKEKKPFDSWSLIVFAILSGIMVFLAVLNLIPDGGTLGIIKAFVIACSATMVSYGVNRFAIEKGAELTATGFASAGAASVISILLVGGALFASTYAGFVINQVRELRLQDHGQELTRFIGKRARVAAEASRTIPVIRANESDLRQHVKCEALESCLSGRRRGGRGVITRALEAKAKRAGAIANQLETGNRLRRTTLSSLNNLLAEYQEVQGQTDKAVDERRRKLIKIDAEIDQMVSRLDEALPVSLLRAFVFELETGVSIPGRSVATRRINELLGKHAKSLKSVLSTIEKGDQTRPVFPAKTGVSVTFEYIVHFLPVAALAAGVEMVYPLALWIYTLLILIWIKHDAIRRQKAARQAGLWRDSNPSRDPGSLGEHPHPNSTRARMSNKPNGFDHDDGFGGDDEDHYGRMGK